MKEFARKFYKSKEWRDFREAYFISVHGICERCGDPGEEVHHQIYLTPGNINDPYITLNTDLVELLCKKCHNLEHVKSFSMHRLNMVKNYKPGDDKYKFVDGEMVLNRNVNIVHGAPASGKTTYVMSHKGKYDIVFDLDYIRMALTLSEDREHIPDTLRYAMDIREVFYQAVEERRHYADTVWIIVTMPRAYERNTLTERLKANIIHIDTDEDECIQRAMKDSSRLNKELQKEIISKYFNDYEQ
ncbi:MAG: HNH endonuclease [Clostridia bacterium]|nr:HNH endonuclease [Clostridia bacterium]